MRTAEPILWKHESRLAGAAQPYHRRRGLSMVVTLGLALPVAMVAWPHFGDAAKGWRDVIGTGGREAPLIRAPSGPIKVLPPAHAAVLETDAVRELLDGNPPLEVDVLQAPEEPIVPPPAAENPVADNDGAPAEPEGRDARPEELAVAALPREAAPPLAEEATQSPAEEATQSASEARLQLEPPPPIVRRAAFTKPQDEAAPRAKAPAAADETARAQAGSVYRIQVAALPTRAEAREVWDAHLRVHGNVLAALRPVIEQGETSTRRFFRVQAGDFQTLAEAQEACRQLAGEGAECVVVRR